MDKPHRRPGVPEDTGVRGLELQGPKAVVEGKEYGGGFGSLT